MEEYIFTFGFGQRYENGYHVINSDDSNSARDEMFRRFGKEWGFQYNPPNAREKAGVDRFELKEII